MAPYISSQAAEICLKDGIGYIYSAGNSYLSFGQVYIEQTGRPNLFKTRRDLTSLYSSKASRVLRVQEDGTTPSSDDKVVPTALRTIGAPAVPHLIETGARMDK